MGKRPDGMMSLPGLPNSAAETKTGVDPIEEMVGALTDPIIVYPSPWMDTIPQWMKDDLTMHRLVHLMKCSKGDEKWDEACDLEALMYIYPASLEFPLDEKWARIYIYLATKVMGDKVPGDVREDSIPDHYEAEMRRLKQWIHKKKVAARRDRRRQAKAEEKLETEPAECEQLKFF